MDCFYAAIEVRDRPSLRGKPVGVGGARDRRGVLTTCNYEARKFGVRSAMPTFMALQRCPNLIVLPTRFDVYRREAAAIRGILYRFTSLIEPLSLDEAYLDVTEHPGAPGPLAQVIRGTIFRKTKLTSSAGIGPNKLIAKIASEINKPNGQFEVTPEQVPDFMENLPVRKIWGIGEKTERKLEELGVKTCGELQRFSAPGACRSFRQIRSRSLRSLPRHRSPAGRAGSSAQIAQHRGNVRCRSYDARAMRRKTRRAFPGFDGRSRAKGINAGYHENFRETKIQRFHAHYCRARRPCADVADFRALLDEAFARTGKPVRLIGVGVRFAETMPENAQMDLL